MLAGMEYKFLRPYTYRIAQNFVDVLRNQYLRLNSITNSLPIYYYRTAAPVFSCIQLYQLCGVSSATDFLML